MSRQRALTEEEARHIRDLYRRTEMSYDHLAAMFKTSGSTIKHVVNRQGVYSKKQGE